MNYKEKSIEQLLKNNPHVLKIKKESKFLKKSLQNKKEKILKQAYNRGGYLFVNLRQCGANNLKLVHRLVLWAFEGHPKGRQCDHINRVRDDNRLENLRWVTRKENMKNQVRSMTFEEYGEMIRLKRLEAEKNKHIQKPL